MRNLSFFYRADHHALGKILLQIRIYTQNWNQIFAGSLIAFLVPVAIILPLQKFFTAGLTSTGAKE